MHVNCLQCSSTSPAWWLSPIAAVHCVLLLQIKAFINEAHYYADATIMFPVWPPEGQHKYTCGHVSSDASVQCNYDEMQSCHTCNSTTCEQSVNSFQHALRCPEGVAESPQQEVTGWGIWMAEKLWAEIQWQYKQAHTAPTAAPSSLAYD